MNVMGYAGDGLKAKFLPDRIRERQDRMAPVTVEGNRDRQEALLAANTAGKMFHLTGGQHMTEDGRWISREMADRALLVGVVHANVGQKLLFCYLVRVFFTFFRCDDFRN
jgi:hypothetical protein